MATEKIEIWKDIKGYENLYQISNLGRVRSLGNNKTRKEKILKPGTTGKDGYLFVGLSKYGKSKPYLVHRLVANIFLDNPNNLPQVNHINEDKTDNRVNNLEWCDSEYNINYGSRNERISKPVYSVDLTTNEITYYKSTIDAERLTNINMGSISSCCNGKRKTAGGYKWYYTS